MHDAAQACRRKGRVVIVGDVGLELRRSDLYEKELDVLMSTSYGPGRYDPVYELEGQDYPIGYVRWTENRNMEEVMRLLATGALDLAALPQERFEIDDAETAYAALGGEQKPLLVLLSYPEREEAGRRRVETRTVRREVRPHRRRARRRGLVRAGLARAQPAEAARQLPDPRRREPHRRDREGRRGAHGGGVCDDRSRARCSPTRRSISS